MNRPPEAPGTQGGRRPLLAVNGLDCSPQETWGEGIMGKWLGWVFGVLLVAIVTAAVYGVVRAADDPRASVDQLASPTTLVASPTSQPEVVAEDELAAPAANPDPFRIAVLGDVGTGETEELLTADSVAKKHIEDPYDGMILLGDNVYEDGNPDRLGATVFEPFAPLLDSGVALWPALGNHDVDDGYGPAQVEALGMPGHWYSVEAGEGLIIVLDSNQPRNGEQVEWLDETLAASDHSWRIVAMHHPLFSAGQHGSSERNRKAFLPILEKHGVDLVLAGHDHDYQRSKPQQGITYIVSGGAAKLRETGTAYFTEFSSSQYHFVDLTIHPDRMEVEAIGREGVFDSAVIDLT